MIQTTARRPVELDKVSKGESREERSGGNEAHIRSGSETEIIGG